MTLDRSDPLVKTLIADEGWRIHPYRDNTPEAYWTVGVGHLIDVRRGGRIPSYVTGFPLTDEQVALILEHDIIVKREEVRTRLPWMSALSEARQGVLLCMAFQMGISGLMKFHGTLSAIKDGDWAAAAEGMRNSLWARQTPKRAERLADVMLSGVWEQK